MQVDSQHLLEAAKDDAKDYIYNCLECAGKDSPNPGLICSFVMVNREQMKNCEIWKHNRREKQQRIVVINGQAFIYN